MINLEKYRPAPRGAYTNRLLTKWVYKFPSIEDAAEKVGISALALMNAMRGGGMQSRTINKILAATGYTYEELFKPPQTPQDAHSAT